MSDAKDVFDRLASVSTPRRKHAVACALELIKAEVSSERGDDLDTNMKRLSEYADQIEKALDNS